MKLSKVYRQAVASLEALERDESRKVFSTGPYSDTALAIESHVDEAASHAAAVVETLHNAMESHSDAGELREVGVESLALREGIETINANGGFTVESLHWANEAAAAVFDRIGAERPLKAPSNEAIDTESHFVVGLEDFDAVVQAVDNARADIAAKSLDGVHRVYTALEDALPEIRDRMQALKNALGSVEYDEEKQIRLDDFITKALSVDGQVPSSLKDYLLGYGRFADVLMGPYSENAQEAASKAPELGDALSGLADDACPVEALAAAFKNIGDPRSSIAPDQLGFVLPGSGPLFGCAVDTDSEAGEVPEGAAGDLMVRMKHFVEDHAPLDPMAYEDRPDAVSSDAAPDALAPPAEAPVATAPTIRVLSKDTICSGLEVLLRIIDGISIKTYADSHQDAWVKSRSAFERYRQALQSLTPTQASNLRPVLANVGEYCDTLFTLSVWPATHFMANLVFTSNAFVLLAERSITGQTEEEPAAMDDEVDGNVDEIAVDTNDGTSGEPLTDVTDAAQGAPDAIADNSSDKPVEAVVVGSEAPVADASATTVAEAPAEPGAPAADEEPVVPAAPAEEEVPEVPAVPGEETTPPAENPDNEPVPAGGPVAPAPGEETPAGTEGGAAVIPAAADEEAEEEEEEGDVIPRAEDEEEEESEEE